MPRFSQAAAVAMLALAAVWAAGQPKSGEVCPDHTAFGTIHVGAIVEGSFQVSEPGRNPGIPFEVTAPKFVKIRKAETRADQFGPGNDFIRGIVEFSIDTSAAGDRSGEFAVTLGKTAVKVPVRATVKPAAKGLTRLLIVETPFVRDSTLHGADFKALTDLVNEASLDVSHLLVNRGKPVLRELDLGKFDCILIAAVGLAEIQPADIKRVRQFADAGGRVVVAASSFFGGTVNGANAILDGYGIKVIDEEAQRGGDDVTLGKGNFDTAIEKAGVKSARFLRASPVRVTDEKLGRVLVNAAGVGRPGEGFVVIGKAGKGEVVALGESLWWNWINGDQPRGTDNAVLLRWLLQPPKQK